MKTIRHHTSSTSNRACSSLSKDNCLTMEAAYEAILRQLHTQGFKVKKSCTAKICKNAVLGILHCGSTEVLGQE